MNPLLARAVFSAIGFALLSSPAMATLKVGDQAPDFRAPGYLAGKPFTFRLAKALKKGPVVLYFFPAPHTSGCNVEAHLFSVAIDDFKVEKATVIGVTAGHLDQLQAFSSEAEHCSGKFAVAADAGAVIARNYDALWDAHPGWSYRVSYVIDRQGKIVHVHSTIDPNDHVRQTLEAVRALK